MSDVVKFYCPCGQKVAVPREKVGDVGNCPRCNSPLQAPDEGVTGDEKVYASVKIQSEDDSSVEVDPVVASRAGRDCPECGEALPTLSFRCKACGHEMVKPSGGSKRRGPARRTSRTTSRDRKRPKGKVKRQDTTREVMYQADASLPLWFWISFGIDAAIFVTALLALKWHWVYALITAEVGAWSIRAIGLKLES